MHVGRGVGYHANMTQTTHGAAFGTPEPTDEPSPLDVLGPQAMAVLQAAIKESTSAAPTPTPVVPTASVASTPVLRIVDEAPDWFPVELIGVTYLCRKAKMLASLSIYEGDDLDNIKDAAQMWALISRLVEDTIHPDHQAAVMARLHDSTDPLDLVHLVNLRNALSRYGLETIPTT